MSTPRQAPDASGSRWIKVWDAPTRLFHWAIVILVLTSYVTARTGFIEWHFRSGYAILGLLLFRIGWGIAGSETARFSDFVRGPRAAMMHLAEFIRPPDGSARAAPHAAGHNPAGAYMVVALLGLLLFQAVTGLFANDGLMVEGPLASYAGGALSDRLTGWHGLGFDLILVAVGMHVLAVLLYAVVARQDLVRPMITGWSKLPASIAQPRMASLLRAAIMLAVAAGLVWGIASHG